jgi:hypothetical protein
VTNSVEWLAYDESRRGLDLQRESLDALRTRAGTIFAAAAIVTTFFGGQVLKGGSGPHDWSVVAIAAFVALGVLCVVVLLPWRFNWILEPSDLVADYVDANESPETMLRDLAIHHNTSRSENKGTLKWLYASFRVAAILFGAEVFAWLLAMPGGN